MIQLITLILGLLFLKSVAHYCTKLSNVSKYYEKNVFIPSFVKQELFFPQIMKSFLPSSSTKIHKALDRIDLNLPKDKVIGIIGPSSCGKSTLGNLLLRRELPTLGSIQYADNIEPIPIKIDQFIISSYQEDQSVQDLFFSSLIDDWYSQTFNQILIENKINQTRKIRELLQSERKIIEILYGLAMGYKANKHVNNWEREDKIGFLLVLDEYLDKEVSSVQKKVSEFLSGFQERNGLVSLFTLQAFFVTHSLYLAKNCCGYILSLENGRLLDYGENFDTIRKSTLIDYI